ncbi:hypothetical protein Q3G72_007496 [Acer saccharum]|nr:hypothetical protein Q3G72_007496 [Acer saccharum]
MRECWKQCRVEDSRSFDHDSVVCTESERERDLICLEAKEERNLQEDSEMICTLDKNQNLEEEEEEKPGFDGKGSSVLESGDGVQERKRDWTTSILLFVLWGVLIYYVYNLTPDQTPLEEQYSCLVIPYTLMLWRCICSSTVLCSLESTAPPPPVEETELSRWPLTFLESKLTAGISLAAGLGLIVYAALAGGDVWQEFYQYFRESKFIHVMSIDFTLLSTFAPFWVYNDLTARKWHDKGSWLLPVSVVPLLGPALYLLLRPSLSEVPALCESFIEAKISFEFSVLLYINQHPFLHVHTQIPNHQSDKLRS